MYIDDKTSYGWTNYNYVASFIFYTLRQKYCNTVKLGYNVSKGTEYFVSL